jgi:hypothetical protein
MMLAERVPANETRMRRDFKQLLAAIKTIALLNQHQRKRDAMGRIIAQLEDYAWARTLLLATFISVTRGGVTEAIRRLLWQSQMIPKLPKPIWCESSA